MRLNCNDLIFPRIENFKKGGRDHVISQILYASFKYKSKIYNELIKIMFIFLSVLAANGVISADFVSFELTVGDLFISFFMVSS